MLLRRNQTFSAVLRNFAEDTGCQLCETDAWGKRWLHVLQSVLLEGLVPFCKRLNYLNLHHMLLQLFSVLSRMCCSSYCTVYTRKAVEIGRVPTGPAATFRIPDFSRALFNYILDKATVIRNL